ncbi:lasso RiPP family leader peptide-containing protein [Actinoalloteichus caeruleus]|uniref:lasso RiPP family leader peptide-containing protein n=1 Tax=Actinoalloteichus cyanogriseus TaxID=2893586 RepID=UPI003AB00ABC
MHDDQPEPSTAAEPYEAPRITEVGSFGKITRGQYSRTISDDSDAGGHCHGSGA